MEGVWLLIESLKMIKGQTNWKEEATSHTSGRGACMYTQKQRINWETHAVAARNDHIRELEDMEKTQIVNYWQSNT